MSLYGKLLIEGMEINKQDFFDGMINLSYIEFGFDSFGFCYIYWMKTRFGTYFVKGYER